ncbi:tRNA 5-methoxyuridine(34)/uridine 5-oxyacetic acid(34) synthase CmoB [Paraperlucidibaca sp.]|uniref:tRNA 5-methoxyuridine(34)/uridine 5-oxyacetic acid(34) synthase CmoB n=1 Tax=Paraperlucidibaca sp. TaxID=2708021 RepID=UPI0030F38E29
MKGTPITGLSVTGPEMIEAYCRQLHRAVADALSAVWAEPIDALTRQRLLERPHGDQKRWLEAWSQLPELTNVSSQLNQDVVTVVDTQSLSADQRAALSVGLNGLKPWRKGPFQFFDTHIDTEWHSDWKWQRVAPHLSDLSGRTVLDVGCGSGYHCWRMAGAGARFVLGIDPTVLFLIQYLSVKRYMPTTPVWFAPLRLEQLPTEAALFDTVFSMGILYHRRSPLDHLLELFGLLRPGGELVLETLVIEGDEQAVLVPHDRYAMMRNVYFLPSTKMLEIWLARCGFTDIRTVDVCVTSVEEQRSTEWMPFQSLPDFLDPQDASKTIEGYTAPRRATLIATRPE